MSNGRERKWELATLRAVARDAAQQLQLPSSAPAGREQQPARRGRDGGKTAKVMHLLLWGPK